MHIRNLAILFAILGGMFTLAVLPSSAGAAPPPTLSIVSPTNNTVIGNGSSVAVVFVVSNFNLTEPGTGTASPNVGHAEVSVNGALIMEVSVDAFRLSLASGPHTILVRLVADNGTALTPDVSASVTVTVTEGPASGRPEVSIGFPREGETLGTDLYVSYRVTNFVLVPPGGPSVPNQGLIRVIVDGSYYQELTDYQPVHLGLSDAPHNVTLQLVD